MNAVLIIPARYSSSRLPGKPLKKINGIPMIKRVYNQCLEGFTGQVIVATDSKIIHDYCLSERMESIMTSTSCLTGTDRVCEASLNFDADFFINVQGDEPVFNPDDIRKFISEIKNFRNAYDVFAAYTNIDNEKHYYSNQIPKMLLNKERELLYTSRSPIPGNKKSEFIIAHRQVCIHGYSKKALEFFASQGKTPLEEIEDLELLRFLENGIKVKMIKLSDISIAVDNPKDILKVESFLNNSENIK